MLPVLAFPSLPGRGCGEKKFQLPLLIRSFLRNVQETDVASSHPCVKEGVKAVMMVQKLSPKGVKAVMVVQKNEVEDPQKRHQEA